MKSKSFTRKELKKFFKEELEWDEEYLDKEQILWVNQLICALEKTEGSIQTKFKDSFSEDGELIIKLKLREM